MSVWFVIPSAKPAREAQECIDAWRAMGYLVAIWRDIGADTVDCDYLRVGDYKGYARSVNALVADVMAYDTDAQWFVTGGDDTWPDQTKRAEVIAAECWEHFVQDKERECGCCHEAVSATFGVMQPTGDGHGIESICGSPWMGREFCARVNQGSGPLWHQYWHMFVDSELQAVAQKLGILWQRPDLKHEHRHYSFSGKIPPPYIRHATSGQHWAESQALFGRRKASGFPGSSPMVA